MGLHCLPIIILASACFYVTYIPCPPPSLTAAILYPTKPTVEMCSLMWDNDIMLNNKFISVYRSSCMCRMLTQTYCKNLLSMCVAMCMFISCNIYVALGARGLNHGTQYK